MYLVIWWRWEVCAGRMAYECFGGGDPGAAGRGGEERHENTDNFTHESLSSLFHMATRPNKRFHSIDSDRYRYMENTGERAENAAPKHTQHSRWFRSQTIFIFMMWLHIVILRGECECLFAGDARVNRAHEILFDFVLFSRFGVLVNGWNNIQLISRTGNNQIRNEAEREKKKAKITNEWPIPIHKYRDCSPGEVREERTANEEEISPVSRWDRTTCIHFQYYIHFIQFYGRYDAIVCGSHPVCRL